MDHNEKLFDRRGPMPMMALRGLTVYPAMLLNFDVERPGSIAALDKAMKDPGLGRSPGEGKGYPLQYSGLEKSMDGIVYGVANSWT